ncbi:MAG: UPF0104 family protein [Anaerolineales bacterium]|nr:UPF0104 family protein [Anaerolineales bacterium]
MAVPNRSVEPFIPPPRIRLLRYLVPLILGGLAVHLLLPQLDTLKQSVQIIKGMTWWVLALAVIAQILSYLGSGYLLRATVAIAGQKITVVRGTMITTASYSIGLVAGGMVGSAAATFRWLRSSGVNGQGAFLAGWLPSLFYDAVLIGASIFGLLHLLIAHDLSPLQAASFSLILFLLLLFVATIVWGGRRRDRLSGMAVKVSDRWAKFRRKPFDSDAIRISVDRFMDAWDSLRTGGWRGPVMGAALNTFFDMLTLFFVFLAAGYHIKPGLLLMGYGFPLLLGKVPLLPGGVGIVESSMVALYTGMGVPNGLVVVVVLTYRLLSFWLPSLMGFPMVLYLQANNHSS